ncbi:hypothetical protein CIHG_02986 [Coccidioides immitis H538.4]|uniref:Uncharacterized protein n=3 Tax=Coccidioides immitis TaxID=5501 RepID=A0A0J8R4N4_COCIT|nr:hypothetical protein CIRG_07689 [Coccidioides immitis RMSCC 2394]KMU79706.1 hypothetical protein CISG_02124 [Coccidioides immitis RMSCC 3703]KMU85203.1 hypothetical protein CIHG_02986 [Coccidioides immitis H538.4]
MTSIACCPKVTWVEGGTERHRVTQGPDAPARGQRAPIILAKESNKWEVVRASAEYRESGTKASRLWPGLNGFKGTYIIPTGRTKYIIYGWAAHGHTKNERKVKEKQ